MKRELLRSEIDNDANLVAEVSGPDAGDVTFLIFGLGSRTYATDVRCVREIVDVSEVQQLPNAPHDVQGMIDLRNRSIPVIDLAARMQITSNPTEDARILVFDFDKGTQSNLVGIIADSVLGVREFASERIEVLEKAISGWQKHGILGVIRFDETQALVIKMEHYLSEAEQPGEFDFA